MGKEQCPWPAMSCYYFYPIDIMPIIPSSCIAHTLLSGSTVMRAPELFCFTATEQVVVPYLPPNSRTVSDGWINCFTASCVPHSIKQSAGKNSSSRKLQCLGSSTSLGGSFGLLEGLRMQPSDPCGHIICRTVSYIVDLNSNDITDEIYIY